MNSESLILHNHYSSTRGSESANKKFLKIYVGAGKNKDKAIMSRYLQGGHPELNLNVRDDVELTTIALGSRCEALSGIGSVSKSAGCHLGHH